MATISRDEILAHAEGVYKLMRARKHLANRGAERACIRLLGSVIKKAEQEIFEPTSASVLIGALYLSPKQKTSRKPRTVNR